MQEDLRSAQGRRALSTQPWASRGLGLDDVVEGVRRKLGGAVRGMLAGEGGPDADVFGAPPGDRGLIGPDSVAWRVHSDIAGLIGGLRALLLQTMHPLAMAGVAEHSDYRVDPFGRLQRTAGFVAVTTFGSRQAAEQAISTVRAVHDRVTGTAPDGRSYSANEPELLTWVHTTEVDSLLKCVLAFGDLELSRTEIDRYFAEVAPVAQALGADDVPTSAREVRAYWRTVRPELRAGAQARDAARFLMVPPLPWVARAPYAVISAAAVSTLPRFVRVGLRLPSPPLADVLAVRPAARALVKGLSWSMSDSPVVDLARRRAAATPAR